MNSIHLKDRLKEIVRDCPHCEKILSNDMHKFFELEDEAPFIVDAYIPSDNHEFKSVMMGMFNNYKKIKSEELADSIPRSIHDSKVDKIEKTSDSTYKHIITGTYFCLQNITLTNKYSSKELFKAHLEYVQRLATRVFSYMRLQTRLGTTEITEESLLIDECYKANTSLLCDMYNYLFNSLDVSNDARIKLAEDFSSRETFCDDAKLLLFKICEKEEIDYLLGLINEGPSINRNSLNVDKIAREYFDEILDTLVNSKEYAKAVLNDKFFKSFYNAKICEFEKNLMMDYSEFFGVIPESLDGKKANDIVENVRNILYLRESLLMHEIAVEKVNTSALKDSLKYRKSDLDNIDLEALSKEVNIYIANSFSHLLRTAKNAPMEDDGGAYCINIESITGENGYLERMFKMDIEFKIDSFGEFRRMAYGLWYEELSTIHRKRPFINIRNNSTFNPFNFFGKSLSLDSSIYNCNLHLDTEIDKSFPSKINLEIKNISSMDKLIDRIVASDIVLEDLAKNKISSSDGFSRADIAMMKNEFIKDSLFFIKLDACGYKHENEFCLFNYLKRIHNLRFLYFKYKHSCSLNESMTDTFDNEEPYLELTLNKIEIIYARLIYCIVELHNEMNPDDTLCLDSLLKVNYLDIIMGKADISTLNNTQNLKCGYEKHVKQFNISNYIEKNPVDEFPSTRKMKRHFIIHSGPTNSGKTYQAIEDLKKASSGIYLAPLRLLAIEIQEKLIAEDVQCNLITGEEELVVVNATHISSTVEKTDYSNEYDVAVIDECQMIGDIDRGGSWTKAILGVKADTIHLCTAPSAVELLTTLVNLCDDTCEVVSHTRNTELLIDKKPFKGLEDCQKGDALVVFSKKNVLSVASVLLSKGIKTSIIYGALPYKTRKLQMEKFLRGETDVIVATDAIGLGLNAPVRRVVFVDSYKYDGYTKRRLFPEEVRQIAGRAGRFGMYDAGYVNAIDNLCEIEEKLKLDYWNIKKARLTLPESIIDVDGDLAENIKLWSEIDSLKTFEKPNVDRILLILAKLKDLGYSDIGKYYSYKLAVMYFEDGDKRTFDLWTKYLYDYFRELKDEMDKPSLESYQSNLQGLESYNKSLELYYAFSKSFSLPMDLVWVREERLKVSEDINAILLSEVKKHRKTCKTCGTDLKWDSLDSKCVKCALKDAMLNSSSGIRFNARKSKSSLA